GNGTGGRPHWGPRPGGESFRNPADLARDFGLPEPVVGRMAYRHGANAVKICELAQQHPERRAQLCPCEQTCYAEAVYCLREENVAHLTDLRRRCRLGMGPCQGTQCAGPAAALLAPERGLSPSPTHRELLRFLDSRLQVKRPVLGVEALAQEELNRAIYLGAGNLDGNSVDG